MSNLTDIFGEVIYAYTRSQAIEDGELVDISSTAKEAGIRFPVAITRAAWLDCVAWPKENAGCQDEAGRLWDVVYMLSMAIRTSKGGQEIRYQLHRVPNTPTATAPRLVTLKALCGPGDQAEPVITIMLPEED